MYEKLFTQQEEVFKVIANQKRLEIIQLLTHGEMTVNEMVEMLGISQSNVSQHLSQLRSVNIVKRRKEGRAVSYSLNDVRIAEACKLIRQFLVSENQIEGTEILSEELDSLYPLIKDPVCGMRMSPIESSAQYRYKGNKYYFCATGCKDKFKKKPSDFISNKLKKGV